MTLVATNKNTRKRKAEMDYTSESMLLLENLREELLRIKRERYFGYSDVDFAREIGLSSQGYRKIVSTDENLRAKYTRSSTIYAIAHRLNMDYEIKKEGEKTYVYFHKKETQEENQGNVTFDNSTFEKFAKLSAENQKLLLDIGRYMDKDVQDLLNALIRKLKLKEQNQEEKRQ